MAWKLTGPGKADTSSGTGFNSFSAKLNPKAIIKYWTCQMVAGYIMEH